VKTSHLYGAAAAAAACVLLVPAYVLKELLLLVLLADVVAGCQAMKLRHFWHALV
jgi:hypothetical protein